MDTSKFNKAQNYLYTHKQDTIETIDIDGDEYAFLISNYGIERAKERGKDAAAAFGRLLSTFTQLQQDGEVTGDTDVSKLGELLATSMEKGLLRDAQTLIWSGFLTFAGKDEDLDFDLVLAWCDGRLIQFINIAVPQIVGLFQSADGDVVGKAEALKEAPPTSATESTSSSFMDSAESIPHGHAS